MIYIIPALIGKRLRNSNALLAVLVGLLAMVTVVACGTLNPNGLNDPATQGSAAESNSDDSQTRQARPPAGLLVRKFEQRNETNISLLQYQQADEYLRIEAPGEIGVPVLLSTRYAQTEHMPIFLEGADASLSTRRVANWGFISFVKNFDKHVRILEGRLANPAKSGDPFIEAIMVTAKLDEIGARVGDHLILVYRMPGGELEPIEVKIVGSWAPLDPKEMYWFYEPAYFSEGLMVSEETYIDVILPGWQEIGYEYTWFSVLDISNSDADAIEKGVNQVREELANTLGRVEIHVLPPGILTQGEE